MIDRKRVRNPFKRDHNGHLIRLSTVVAGVTAALLNVGTAFAQGTADTATNTANASPTLISLFLLLVGLVGVAIIGARMIDLPSIMSRSVQSGTMLDDDALVPDDPQV